jgi:hypothetical protein
MAADGKWDAAAAVRLSDGYELVRWPPRLASRIHFNSGYPQTSWTAEVRAVVDNEVVVVQRLAPAYAVDAQYSVLLRWEVENRQRPLHYGPLPRVLCQRPAP